MRARLHKWRFSENPAAFLSSARKLRSHSSKPSVHAPPPEDETKFINAKDAAIWLGIPLRSLHQYVQRGLLPCYKIGRHRLFRKDQLLVALEKTVVVERSAILR